MSDLEKAARLALEVTRLIGADLVCDAAHHKKADRHGIGEPCPVQARWDHAFAALRQALDQPKQRWAVFCARCRKEWSVPYEHPGKSVCKECATHLLQALEQPAQQKPVYFCDYGYEGWGKVDAAMAAENLASGMTVEAYYTSPQRKPWVGLTDEDLSVCDEDGVMLARYWEAKLREKNT